MRFKARILSVLGLLLIAAWVSILALTCGIPTNSKEQETQWLNHHDSVQYVGTKTCLQCHQDKHSFLHTGMGLSFDTANKNKSIAEFAANTVVYDTAKDLYYRPFWQGETMFIEEYRLEGRDTTHKLRQEVHYIFGSGQHTQSHAMLRNGLLFQLPLTWYAQKKTWDLPPGFEGGNNSRFGRWLDLECVSCHNALPEMKPQSNRVYHQLEKGIGCERCHGPGSMHVQRRSTGKAVLLDDGTDPSIVHPGRLSWERQIDLCQRCHLQGLNVLQAGKTFADFRPGMKLSSVFDIFLPEYEGPDGKFDMANHAQRLQMSECFKQSNVQGGGLKLTCVTCHNPHVSVKITGYQVFNDACNSCHISKKCSLSETERKKKNNDCSGCHMPASGTDDIPHVTVHDHYIRKPIGPKDREGMTKLAGLYSVNNTNTSKEELLNAYLLYFEKFDKNPFWLTKAEALISAGGIKEKIHLAYLREQWSDIRAMSETWLSTEKKDAWTAYRLGEAFLQQTAYRDASWWFEQALQLDSDAFDWRSKYAVSLLGANKIKEAEAEFIAVLNLHPDHAHALTNLGYLYMEQRQFSRSKKQLEHCLSRHPDHLPALENALRLSILTADALSAQKMAKRILKASPNHPESERLKQISQNAVF